MNRIYKVGTLVSVADAGVPLSGATGRIKTLIKTPTRHGSMNYAAAQKEHKRCKAKTNVAIMERGDNHPKTETSAPDAAPVITPLPAAVDDPHTSLQGVLALVMAGLFPHFDGTAVDAVKEMAAWITTAREAATRRQNESERLLADQMAAVKEADTAREALQEVEAQRNAAEDEIRSLVHELEDVRAVIVPSLPGNELPMARVHISITVATGGTLNVYGGTS